MGAKGSAAGVHQRVDGAARLEHTCAGDGRTRLRDLYQRAPCRVSFPAPETGMGERFESGRLHDAWYVTRGGRPVWIDVLRLEGDVGRLRAAPFGLGTCVAYSTLLYVGADSCSTCRAPPCSGLGMRCVSRMVG